MSDVPPGNGLPPANDLPEVNKVECHSGYEYAERPVAFHWQGNRLEIEAIEAQWRIPGGKRFRVRTQDGQIFELFYAELYDEWRINPA